MGIEWETVRNEAGEPVLTGRWRRRQFYAQPGVRRDKRVPSERTACEWRTGKP